MEKYVISVDQSTQGTKALLFDNNGNLLDRTDLLHEQIVNEQGWVSHNPEEIYKNTVSVIKNLVSKNEIKKENVVALGISNQRETTVIWDKQSGRPIDNAIVWQCNRAEEICARKNINIHAEMIRERTGMVLSPYFPASKIAWFLENVELVKNMYDKGEVCHGTVDTYLVFRLTNGESYKTDYSNASRTQLFNIFTLQWDKEICDLFGINIDCLAEVVDSDSYFGETTLDGFFEKPVPIHSVLGDSHAALFGQGCVKKGMIKSTYGTGSSVMMNIGNIPKLSSHGVVTSLAWSRNNQATYVLEGNINYTGAVITWLKDDMGMISSPAETEELAKIARQSDSLYLVPSFTGLGAPYWDSNAKASIVGMSRTTGKAEIVKAGLESIAYQIADIVTAMEEDSEVTVKELRVDGGPTRNKYLMQFQSDITKAVIKVPDAEELSGIGVAYMAGIAISLYDESIFDNTKRINYIPYMKDATRDLKLSGWKNAVKGVLTK